MEETVKQGVRPAPDAEPVESGASSTVLAGPTAISAGRLLDRLFGREDIALVRHEVSSRLSAAGLAGDRLHGFVLAVNEVVTNAVLHAGGSGRLLLQMSGPSAWCTVTDSGPGIPARFLAAHEVPEAFEVGGRGLWLAYQLCDEVTVATGPIGTTVGLRITLATPGGHGPEIGL